MYFFCLYKNRMEYQYTFNRAFNGTLIIAGTALWLLKRYNELADLKEENDLTTLQLLTKMPSAFKSQTQMGAFKNFIYPRNFLLTLPLSNKHACIYSQIYSIFLTESHEFF
jgi:hypothetical protein